MKEYFDPAATIPNKIYGIAALNEFCAAKL